MHSYSFMGGFTAKALSIFLSLVATLCFTASTFAWADAHDGLGGGGADDIDIPMDSLDTDQPREARQGAVVGNLRPPQGKKPEDFLFKNMKNKEYPIEFLIPFMKVSQVFQKRIPAKEQPREQSAMQPKRAVASEEAKAKARPWAKEFNEKMAAGAPTTEGSEAWPENLKEAMGQVERANSAPKPNVIGARPAAKPPGALLKNLKAD